MPLNLQHQTPAEFADRLQRRFRAAEREEKARLAAWIYDRYQAGDVTAAQLRNAFEMNTAQFQAFVARIQTLRDHWVAIQAERAK